MDEETYKAFKSGLSSGVRVVAVPQLFETPDAIASLMVNIANIPAGASVLEPSAGCGAILRHIPATAKVRAIEINGDLCANLRARFPGVMVAQGDFLELVNELGEFDFILMNPPFSEMADIKHIQAAASILKSGGLLVAICAGGPRQERKLKDWATSWERLPPGTFKDSGTSVNVVLLTYRKK